MNVPRKLATGIAIAALGGLSFGIPAALASADSPVNKDPHNGQQVNLFASDSFSDVVTKRCDGTTLVYLSPTYDYVAGIAVIPNSPECK